jgi:rhomboid protease GluP
MIMEQTRKPIFISHILIAINVIVYGLMMFYDSKLSVMTLIQFGAKINYRIADFELYRLVTPMFLHAGLAHLGFNCYALHLFGRDTEMIFGKARFLIIYFTAGIIGTIGSFLFNDNVSVGASGAIFGLIGANLYLFTLNRDVYKRIFGNNIFILLGINVVYGFINPMIDNTAHLSGLIGGFMAAWATGYRYQVAYTWKNWVARVGIVGLVTLSLTFGIPAYKNSSDYFFKKGYFTLLDGQVETALQLLKTGESRFPGEQSFNELIAEIEKFKQQLNTGGS